MVRIILVWYSQGNDDEILKIVLASLLFFCYFINIVLSKVFGKHFLWRLVSFSGFP